MKAGVGQAQEPPDPEVLFPTRCLWSYREEPEDPHQRLGSGGDWTHRGRGPRIHRSHRASKTRKRIREECHFQGTTEQRSCVRWPQEPKWEEPHCKMLAEHEGQKCFLFLWVLCVCLICSQEGQLIMECNTLPVPDKTPLLGLRLYL